MKRKRHLTCDDDHHPNYWYMNDKDQWTPSYDTGSLTPDITNIKKEIVNIKHEFTTPAYKRRRLNKSSNHNNYTTRNRSYTKSPTLSHSSHTSNNQHIDKYQHTQRTVRSTKNSNTQITIHNLSLPSIPKSAIYSEKLESVLTQTHSYTHTQNHTQEISPNITNTNINDQSEPETLSATNSHASTNLITTENTNINNGDNDKQEMDDSDDDVLVGIPTHGNFMEDHITHGQSIDHHGHGHHENSFEKSSSPAANIKYDNDNYEFINSNDDGAILALTPQNPLNTHLNDCQSPRLIEDTNRHYCPFTRTCERIIIGYSQKATLISHIQEHIINHGYNSIDPQW
eukprot:155429_1